MEIFTTQNRQSLPRIVVYYVKEGYQRRLPVRTKTNMKTNSSISPGGLDIMDKNGKSDKNNLL